MSAATAPALKKPLSTTKVGQFATDFDMASTKNLETLRYKADTDLKKVKAVIAEHRITDVCAIDNQHKLKHAFLNEQGWAPVYYLFDSEGKLKSRAAGEFGIGVLTTALEKMFADKSNGASA